MENKNIKPDQWQNLSKKEKKQWKKEQKRLKKEKEAKINRITKLSIIFGTIIFISASFFGIKYFKAKYYAQAPKIQLIPQDYDFGKISASKGKAETDFEIKNTGKTALTISGMETSCGCTNVILENNGVQSPVFGMHNNPTNWSTLIEPEKTAKLKVIFDPNFHQNTFGPLTRIISVFSNDPRQSKAKATIYVNVEK